MSKIAGTLIHTLQVLTFCYWNFTTDYTTTQEKMVILSTPGYSIKILKQFYKISYLLGANQLL